MFLGKGSQTVKGAQTVLFCQSPILSMKDTLKLSNQVWQYAIFLPSGVAMSATTCFCYPKYFSKKLTGFVFTVLLVDLMILTLPTYAPDTYYLKIGFVLCCTDLPH